MIKQSTQKLPQKSRPWESIFSMIFLFIVFILFWSICECTVPIFTDDMIYADWTKHGIRYFFEQILWHYQNFNGRTLTHSLLSILLIAKEHLYSVFIPFAIGLFAFLLHGIIRQKSTIYEKVFVSGITMLGFLGLSKFYLTYSVIWMSSGANYILPLIFVALSYKVYQLARYNEKLRIWSLILLFLSGATTEQYGMYTIGLVTMTMFFDLIDKKYKNIKYDILALIFPIIGLLTVILAPGISSRAEGHIVGIGEMLDIFYKNNYTMSGYSGHSVIMFVITLCFGLIGIDKNHRIMIIGIPVAIANYFLCLFGCHNIAAITLFSYLFIICFYFLYKKDMREYGKIMVCGCGTFLMMSITNIGGFRICIPLLVSIIFTLSSIYFDYIKSNPKKVFYRIVLICVMFLCLLNGLKFYTDANNTAQIYSNPLYEELSNAKNTGVVNVNYDYADVYNGINHVRHTTCFDTGMLLDIKYCQNYFGYSDDTRYHHTSTKYEVFDVSYNGRYYVVPIVKENGKLYVPYTLLVMNEETTCTNLSQYLSDYSDDNWMGHIIDKDNLFAMSGTEKLVSKKNGEIIYESDNVDCITHYFKSSPSNFIELSQFCEWADVSYTFDEATNTYHITEN